MLSLAVLKYLSNIMHLSISVGGNCNTVLVANIYGEAAQIEETVRSGIYDIKQKATVFFLLHMVSYRLWMIINILCSSLLCVSPAE